MKIWALFTGVSQRAVDLMRRGGTPFAALTTLTLQLCMAAQSHPVKVVPIYTTHCVLHLQAVQRLNNREDTKTMLICKDVKMT